MTQYKGFADGAKLLLWYQNITASPGDVDDTTFSALAVPEEDPNIRIIGGKGANVFKIEVKGRVLDLSTVTNHIGPIAYAN